jgi:hypothetical protein
VAEAQALDDDGCEIAKGAMEAGEWNCLLVLDQQQQVYD